MSPLSRREILAGLGVAAAAATIPGVAEAKPRKPRRTYTKSFSDGVGLRDYSILVGPPGGAAPDHPVFGAAVTAYPNSGRTWSQEFTAHEADCGTIGCYRSYSGAGHAWPTTWNGLTTTSGSTHPRLGNWQARWSWHSLKPDPQDLAAGTEYTNIRNFIASIPVTGMKRLISFWHEPEAKIPGTFTAAEFNEMQWQVGNAIKDENHPDVMFGPVFMSKFTLDDVDACRTSGNARDLSQVYDFIGWDPYNEASNTPDYNYGSTFQPIAYYYQDCVDYTATHFGGLPIAIGETGYAPDNTNLTRRPTWLTNLGAYAVANNFLAVCYFDASITSPWWLRAYEAVRDDDTTLTPDPGSIDAWADLYTAYPPY